MVSSALYPGNMRASEPVASTTFFAFTVSAPPAVSATSTVNTPSFAGPVSLPNPLKVVILFFFIRKSRPLVCREITSSLRASTFFQFSAGAATSMPYLSACFRWSHTSAVNSMALVGMHPHSRHVPPSRSFASTSATFRAILRLRIARYIPPAHRPPPPHRRSSPPPRLPSTHKFIRNPSILRCLSTHKYRSGVGSTIICMTRSVKLGAASLAMLVGSIHPSSIGLAAR